MKKKKTQKNDTVSLNKFIQSITAWACNNRNTVTH